MEEVAFNTIPQEVRNWIEKDQDIVDVAYHKARDLQSQNKRKATHLEAIDLRLRSVENTLACLVENNRPKSTA